MQRNWKMQHFIQIPVISIASSFLLQQDQPEPVYPEAQTAEKIIKRFKILRKT